MIRMRGPWALLKRLDPSSVPTKGGLFLPSSARELSQLAIVISVGPGIRKKKGGFLAPEYSEGDVVMFKQFDFISTQMEGHVICHQRNIILRIKDFPLAEKEEKNAQVRS